LRHRGFGLTDEDDEEGADLSRRGQDGRRDPWRGGFLRIPDDSLRGKVETTGVVGEKFRPPPLLLALCAIIVSVSVSVLLLIRFWFLFPTISGSRRVSDQV